MVSTSLDDSAAVADKPPSYETRGDGIPDVDNKGSGKDQKDPGLLASASRPPPQRPEASTRRKPIIVTLRQRQVKDVKDFQVGNLYQFTVVYELKDVLLLDLTTTFEEIRDQLLYRSRRRRVLPAENDHESVLSLVSISTNHRTFKSDIVGLDEVSWEAGRELLLTKEDAILRLDAAVISTKPVEQEQEKQNQEKSSKCVVQ